MLVAPVPTWRQLCKFRYSAIEKKQDTVYTKGSAISLKLIIQAYKEINGKEKVVLLLPDYFCGETEAVFVDSTVVLERYPLTERFEPDWNYIKEHYTKENFDFFVIVHFFGIEHDTSRARVFADQHSAVLIEDCAHVLYPYGKIGKRGDIAVYSPHKQLPIPEGGIISFNSDNADVKQIFEIIEKVVSEDEHVKRYLLWRAKKLALKILRVGKSNDFNLETHYLSNKADAKMDQHAAMDKYSRSMYSEYSYEMLKEIAYRRRENLKVVNFLLKSIDPKIKILIDEAAECPLFAVASLENVENPDKVLENIKKKKIGVSFWPTVSNDNDSKSEQFLRNTRFIITIPVHQSIELKRLIKKIDILDTVKNDLVSKKIFDTSENREIWNEIASQSEICNITQDWQYGEVKQQTENWKVERYIIEKGNEQIGIVQLLEKKIFGITAAYRVNKGPIFIKKEASIDNEICTIEKIRRMKPKRPFFYVPYDFSGVQGQIKMVQNGWNLWDIFGFPTGYIDLSKSEDDIRKSLDSKWRNQLKNAEKKNFKIISDTNRFDEMLTYYSDEQEEKGFKGVDLKVLKTMKDLIPSPLRVFYVLNDENEIMAFDMFYVHSNAATYYIGWNSEEGRRNYMNNFLLFKGALLLKEEGIEKLDLGGIEYIHTESIAKFKDGMNPQHFKQLGEFMRFF